jgi:DNA repair exonuclease SbcCD ATPase subunit
MTIVQISFDELNKLHKDLQQKQDRIRFLEIISNADSKQVDTYIAKQKNLIQSLQNELKTVKAVQNNYLNFNKTVANENKELRSNIEKLKTKFRDREQSHAKVINLYRNNLNQLETRKCMYDQNEKIIVLEQEIDRLKAIIKSRNLVGKNTLIGDFKLTNLNNKLSTDSVVLSGAYVIEKLDKVQSITSDFIEVDEYKNDNYYIENELYSC